MNERNPRKVQRRFEGHFPVHHLFLLVFLILSVYFSTLHHPFVYDDKTFITQNPRLQSAQYIPKYFSEDFCKGVAKECSYYRPLVSLSYLIDYLVWGENPFGFHLTNIVIHVMVVLIFYVLTWVLFQNTRISIISSLLFAVHPIHVESVAFVAARTDPPAAVFFLLSFLFFHGYLRNGRIMWPVAGDEGAFLQTPETQKGSGSHPRKVPEMGGNRRRLYFTFSLLFFTLGVFTKEITVALPLVLLIYDLLFIRPWKGLRELFSRWRSYLPFALVVFIYLVVRRAALGYGLTQDLVLEELWFRILAAPAMVWDYFKIQIIPFPLTLFHDPAPLFGSVGLTVSWGILFLGLYLFFIFYLGRNSKGVLFGCLWFLVTLLPVLHIIPIPWPMVVERYSYIPSLGFVLAVGFFGNMMMERPGLLIRLGTIGTVSWMRRGLVGGFVLVLGVFSFLSVDRIGVWSDEILLWEDAVRKAPHFALGHMNLGIAYQDRGEFEKAAWALQNSLKYDPDNLKIYHNLGVLYQETGEFSKALETYHMLIEKNRGSPHTYHNLGMIYEKLGDSGNAVRYYLEALNANPNLYNSQVRLARVWMRMGESGRALEAYEKAVRIYPERRTPYLEMGELYRLKGQTEKAVEAFRLFLEYSPPEKQGSEAYLFAEKRLRALNEGGYPTNPKRNP